jgi:hypothetical protein
VLEAAEGGMEGGDEATLLHEQQVLEAEALRLLEASYRVGEDRNGTLDG